MKYRLKFMSNFLTSYSEGRKNTMPFYGAGFTLIEMIVAIAVFTVVMTVTLATYLNVSDIQRKANALRVVNDNVSFALETMTREIRTNKDYTDCGAKCLSFTNDDSQMITYSFNSTDNSIERDIIGDSNPPLRLTSPDIKIEDLVFNIRDGVSAQEQPMVTIFIKASAGEKIKIKNTLNVQTTITKRELGSGF
ncbi:MAG: type II secretion system protein [Candidatus Magasanikbacteria bacterium]